jgi:hypothetical protein
MCFTSSALYCQYTPLQVVHSTAMQYALHLQQVLPSVYCKESATSRSMGLMIFG